MQISFDQNDETSFSLFSIFATSCVTGALFDPASRIFKKISFKLLFNFNSCLFLHCLRDFEFEHVCSFCFTLLHNFHFFNHHNLLNSANIYVDILTQNHVLKFLIKSRDMQLTCFLFRYTEKTLASSVSVWTERCSAGGRIVPQHWKDPAGTEVLSVRAVSVTTDQY